jgi:glucose/arabinose dehydrogenase
VRRWLITLGSLTVVLGLAVAGQAQTAEQPGFSVQTVWSGLNWPTAIEFAPDGRVFVAEKAGLVKVFDSLTDPTPTTVIDVSGNVGSFWDRGLLGMALHPNFASNGRIYLLYTLDLKVPGCNADSSLCMVGGRLSRFTISGNNTAGAETVIFSDRMWSEGVPLHWCQQYASHSIGDLVFDQNGNLLISAGDGASYNDADEGQFGNPCQDPPREGGALRSQDLRTSGDPVSYDGTILRVNPDSFAAAGGNPSSQDNRIIAHGLRNPFRITVRPGTNEVWIGDVGWNTWEEINRVQDPGGAVDNFGWPCYEGSNVNSSQQPGYFSLNNPICQGLYAAGAGAVVAPHYAYTHGTSDRPPGCSQANQGAVSGLAFYNGQRYPATYDGALFFADYAIQCVRAMRTTGGVPDKNKIDVIVSDMRPVDLKVGPDGNLYIVDIYTGNFGPGRILRLVYNNGPTAVASATPSSGPVPLNVQFSSAGSTHPGGSPLSFAWDLDGDGQYNDSTAANPSRTYTTPGNVTVGLRVTDNTGASSFASVTVSPTVNNPPNPVISTPSASLQWEVGQTINFSGSATDPDSGNLPASALTWTILLNHCTTGGDCHVHQLQTFTGVASGSFTGPDHEYPSYLTIALTATDPQGAQRTVSRDLQPRTSNITLAANPAGINVTGGSHSGPAPLTVTGIVGAEMSISASSSQVVGGTTYNFVSWSDGGARVHVVSFGSSNKTITANYVAVGGEQVRFGDVPANHPYFSFVQWLAAEGITAGCSPTLYCPNAPVTREQMATFIALAIGLPPGPAVFSDVAGSPHAAHIYSIAAAGITSGCGGGKYCPQALVTRGEMATFLARALNLPPGPDVFNDTATSIHRDRINSIAAAGITAGCSPGMYCPNAYVTRGEMAVFLFRAFGP